MAKTRTTYRELDMFPIPEDIPELGIEAGTLGTVDHTYPVHGDDGRGLYVELSAPDGRTLTFAQVEADERGVWRLVAYTPFD